MNVLIVDLIRMVLALALMVLRLVVLRLLLLLLLLVLWWRLFGGPLQACQGGASIQYCPQIQAPRTCSSSSEHPYPKRDEAPWRADRMLGSLPEGLHDARKTPQDIDCHGAKGVQAHAGKREIGTSARDELVPSVDTERTHLTEREWMTKHLVLVLLGAWGQWACHNGLSPTCVP